ncbi:MAG: ATP-binding protein [Treponema sp.]|nr:ATP-binding protein [Treponema sp.]
METTETNGLLPAVGEIVALAEKHKLSKEFFEAAQPRLEEVAKVLRITETQAALFALVLEHSYEETVSVGAIAKAMNCGKIEILKYMDDFETLEKKSLIRSVRDRYASHSAASVKLPSYHVPMDVIKILRTGRYCRNTAYSGLTGEEFLDTARELLEARRENDINDIGFLAEIKMLFNANVKSAFVQGLKTFNLSVREGIDLAAFILAWLDEEGESMTLRGMRSLLTITEIRSLERRFQKGDHKFIREELIASGNDRGMADSETWTLCEKAKETFLADMNLKERKHYGGKKLIRCNTIQEKTLYYGEKINTRIGELASLLIEENFAAIKTRLAEQKLSAVFTVLFQGPPGTGKTETAWQIARQTGRDIFLVDISETKSQWFGESEKRIKALFDRYKAMVKNRDITPIMLFNEADGVLGKRQELGDTRRGPAQTENAIQNIILQEMENLTGGILIATTNMLVNFDKAFERRFLYKIEFENPDQKARAAIWQNRLPDIDEEAAETLSRRFEFSGGQIENIASKQAINTVLHGATPNLDGILNLCEDEIWAKGAKRIGFTVN